MTTDQKCEKILSGLMALAADDRAAGRDASADRISALIAELGKTAAVTVAKLYDVVAGE